MFKYLGHVNSPNLSALSIFFNMIMSSDNYSLFTCEWSNKDHSSIKIQYFLELSKIYSNIVVWC